MGGCPLASLIPAALAAQESAALCQLLWGIDACGLRSAFNSTWFFHSVIPAQGSVRNFHSSLREISFMFARSKHTAHTFRSGGTIDTAVLIEVRSTRLDEKTESMSCSHLNKLKMHCLLKASNSKPRLLWATKSVSAQHMLFQGWFRERQSVAVSHAGLLVAAAARHMFNMEWMKTNRYRK